MPPAERDREIERLKTANRNLKAENRHMRRWADDKVAKARKHYEMPRALYNALVTCLHPDKPQPTEKQRAETCGLLTQWKKDQDKARKD